MECRAAECREVGSSVNASDDIQLSKARDCVGDRAIFCLRVVSRRSIAPDRASRKVSGSTRLAGDLDLLLEAVALLEPLFPPAPNLRSGGFSQPRFRRPANSIEIPRRCRPLLFEIVPWPMRLAVLPSQRLAAPEPRPGARKRPRTWLSRISRFGRYSHKRAIYR